jgi:drug/metabolite transporter (DMT)-like permease
MVSDSIGSIYAVLTAVCWAISALAFERAGRTFGTLALNLVRITIAAAALCSWSWIETGSPWPVALDSSAWGWLTLSSMLGLVFGDLCLFFALVAVGPRQSLVMMAGAPALAATISWFWLHESLQVVQLFGIALTCVGIGAAVLGSRPEPGSNGHNRRLGLIAAFGAALGQAGGLVTSKEALALTTPIVATQVRLLVATAAFLILAIIARSGPRIAKGWRDRNARLATLIGTFFGPVAGVSFSLAAISNAPVGVASSIFSTTPIILLLVARIQGHRVTLLAWIGTLITVSGVALLFLTR